MADSDVKGDLGGLARSIDALFSQTAASTDDVAAAEPLDSAPPMEEPAVAPMPVGDPIHVGEAVEPDPFEALEAHEEAAAEPDTEPVSHSPDVQLARELARDSLEAPAADEMPGLAEAFPAEVMAQAGQADLVTEPAGAGLDDAVESFLSGAPGAAVEVRAISAKLRERLALDPLADAVERLVHSGRSTSDEDASELAREVINPAVASRIVQRMGQEEDDERRAAYAVLSERVGVVMANAFRGALTTATGPGVRRACHEGLLAMGETSRPVIEAMVEDDNRFLVLNAVALLGEMGGEGAVELVTSTLANTDARVRCEALGSLGKLGAEDSGQLVMASLEDSDAKVRAAAAVAAGALGVERALRPILHLMEDEDDPSVVVPLLEALGSLGDPGAVQAIEKRAVATLFSKPPTEIRVAAYRALHEIGTPHACELIQKASGDKDPVVRTTVRGLASTE